MSKRLPATTTELDRRLEQLAQSAASLRETVDRVDDETHPKVVEARRFTEHVDLVVSVFSAKAAV